ncbi:uncharacterized protein LOC130362238 [Hyla sarda]|uniref:uncharacterized protein LOC130362238 n=1 Tax=Hyla sarda TaxID=327740 RepID=UPI0024C43066|nr:uncharacterized protein LOC130362238 [Hyla sarda]
MSSRHPKFTAHGMDPEELLLEQRRLSKKEGFEKGLSVSTLKVQGTALGAVIDQQIVDHRWIKRFFRALSTIKPKIPVLTPSWNLNWILSALTSSLFQPLDEVSLKYLTFKTTFLIAITTARRVGEIQALSIKEPDDRVTLRLDPAFLPKVVSTGPRKLYFHLFVTTLKMSKKRHNNTLDVRRCLLKYLEVSNPWRKDDNLLLQFQGLNKVKKASKSSIARWLKLVISEAYSSRGKQVPKGLKAHSTRAMSASWAERSAASID